MGISTIGLDLAKNVFQVHGVDERGSALLRKQLRRDQVVPFFARLQPCVIGIEACSGAHYWAGKLRELGHTVRMMSPQGSITAIAPVLHNLRTAEHDRNLRLKSDKR